MKNSKPNAVEAIEPDSEEIPEDLKRETREMFARNALSMGKQIALVNPFGKRMKVRDIFISKFFAGEHQSTMESSKVSDYFIHVLQDLTADDAEQEFKRIIRLKRESEKLKHRNYYALIACERYISEVGKPPSKPKLKKYMIARREIFLDQPPEGDGKGWTRLWETSSVLSSMPDS